MTKTVYLAGPIDQGQAWSMRAEAREALRGRGYVYFDPSTGWDVPPDAEPSANLQRANIAALRQCDALLVCLDPSILSIGATLEIVEAVSFGTPVAVWAKIRPSWALAYLGVPVFEALDKALDEIGACLDV